jgi:hypothetical protein
MAAYVMLQRTSQGRPSLSLDELMGGPFHREVRARGCGQLSGKRQLL